MSKKFLSFMAFIIMVAALSPAAKAASSTPDLFDVPRPRPLERRKYNLASEFTLNVGYLASDPFIKYLSTGLSYTTYFTNFLGWEVFNANYALGFNSGLKNDLIQNFNVNPNQFDSIEYWGTSNLVFTPLYTKNLLFNSSVIFSQISLVLGGGAAMLQQSGVQPVFDFGIILRYYLGPHSCLKADFRDNLFPSMYQSNNLTLTLGYAVNFGGYERK